MEQMQDTRYFDDETAEDGSDPMVNRVEGGKLVPVRWSQLTKEEQRQAYRNFEASLGM